MTSLGEASAQSRPGLVITAVGPDRPGLIFDLSTRITAHGGNIEDTKMSKLGGAFALLVLVTGAESVLSELFALRSQLEQSLGVTCSMMPTHAEPIEREQLWRFSASGFDRPGIVSTVSDLLAKRQVNVVSFLSRIENAPLSGTPLFILEAECALPQGTAISDLEQALRAACEQEGLELASN